MGFDDRLRRVEEVVKNLGLDQPVKKIVFITVENREQVTLCRTIPDDAEIRYPDEFENLDVPSLRFHEYVDCIPKRYLRKEDVPAWEEQCRLSRELSAAEKIAGRRR